ncbi:MAG: protein-glutamate O-methyltransferase CheR [Caulobacteraceae bacterium]
MKPEDLDLVAATARARAGLALRGERAFFVESRLAPLARREGAISVAGLIERLRATADGPLAEAIAQSLSTTETSFFRDRAMFDRLRTDILPALAARRPEGRLNAWCAGVATGQEAYSLAMLVEEERGRMGPLQLDIFATDFVSRALEKAQSGLYTHFEVQRGLPIRLLIRHFEKTDDAWRISTRLRQAIRWRQVNLIVAEPEVGPFDLILCRNVLSGLDPEVRPLVLSRLADALVDDGVLVLGADESAGLPEAFEPTHGSGVYRRNPGFRRAAA